MYNREQKKKNDYSIIFINDNGMSNLLIVIYQMLWYKWIIRL